MDYEDLLVSSAQGCAAALADIHAGDTFQILDLAYGNIEHHYLAIADAETSGELVMIAAVVNWPRHEAFKLNPLVFPGTTRLWVIHRGEQDSRRAELAKQLAIECDRELARA